MYPEPLSSSPNTARKIKMLSEVFYDADRFKRNIAKDRPQPVEKVTVCTSRTIYFQEFIENGFGDFGSRKPTGEK